MRQSTTVTSLPAAEPLMLQEAKNWLKVDTTDDDALIAVLITTATQFAENELRRKLITQTVKLTIDAGRSEANDWLGDGFYDLPVTVLSGSLPRSIDLPYAPIQSVTSVVTYGVDGTSSTLSSANYYVDTSGAKLVLYDSGSWPSDIRAAKSCEITYVAGYGDTSTNVPSPIKTAMLMHVKEMYDMRLPCEASDGIKYAFRGYRHYG